MDMTILDILTMLVGLIAAFASQVYLVKRTVEFAKGVTGWKDNKVRWLSFGIGFFIGALFLWPWIVLNPGLHISFYVVIGVLFLLVAGLVASGDYDLANPTE